MPILSAAKAAKKGVNVTRNAAQRAANAKTRMKKAKATRRKVLVANARTESGVNRSRGVRAHGQARESSVERKRRHASNVI